jgi:hypothetical protein
VLQKRVLRKIFGPNRDEVTGKDKKRKRGDLRSVLLTNYYSGDKINKNEIGGTCSTYGGEERCIQ